MNLLHVTLTGPDDHTSRDEMRQLSADFPIVEWAVLFSSTRAGSGRYPSLAWREAAAQELSDLKLSAHLCGRDVERFANRDEALLDELQSYKRIQLNFNARRLRQDIQDKLLSVVEELSVSRPELRIITQHNSANAAVRGQFAHIPTTQALFDASGGRGVAPEMWQPPLSNTVCGYAGSLGPENVQVELLKISTLVGDAPFWMDMETRIRTPCDKLDREKCRRVLEQVFEVLH